MTMIKVEINDEQFEAMMKLLDRELKDAHRLAGRVARHMRDYVRQTFTIQGRGSRPWAPLRPLTREKTGRRKPLITLRETVKVQIQANRSIVFAVPRSFEWSLNTHHEGYRVPETRKRMIITMPTRKIFLRTRKAFTVPARPIWPTEFEVLKETAKVVDAYIKELDAKL